MKYKITPIVTAHVRKGNWDQIFTALNTEGESWRLNDQRLASRATEAARHAKHQRDGLAAFREELAKLRTE